MNAILELASICIFTLVKKLTGEVSASEQEFIPVQTFLYPTR